MRQAISAQEIYENPPPLPEALIEGILNVGELAIVSAPYDSFKSFLSLEMARAVATGDSFLGKFPVKGPSPVYFFQAEITKAFFAPRVNALRMSPEHRAHFWMDYDRMELEAKCIGILEQIIEVRGVKLVILDPLANFWVRGMRENDSGMVATALRPLLDLRKTGTSFVIVHGDTKSEGESGPVRARGSSELLYRPDQRIFLDRLNDAGDVIDSARITMRPRNGQNPRAFYTSLVGGRMVYDDDPTLPEIFMQKIQAGNYPVSLEVTRQQNKRSRTS